MSFSADVTDIVTRTGGNGVYFVNVWADDPEVNRLPRGVSLVIVYTHPEEPRREINIYAGYFSTETGSGSADLRFGRAYAGGEIRLFINAIDGQADVFGAFEDNFLINDIDAGGAFPGTSRSDDAWIGIGVPPSQSQGREFDELYDHGEGDISDYTTVGQRGVRVTTVGNRQGLGDCIGHSVAAVSFLVP